MTEPILHHYPHSPFSEKVRLMLGFKQLDWRSVRIPVIMPKPDLTALTGGYRRTPVLQLGADVYCDTALIARVLEDLRPSPTLFPASAPLAPLLAQWADSALFWSVIPYATQPAGVPALFPGATPDDMKAFAQDRAPFTAGLKRQTVADATAALRHHLRALDAQLADARAYLFGAEPSVADFAVAHGLWFIRLAGPVADILQPFSALSAWLQRMLAIGHGRSERMDSAAAIAVAAGAGGHAPVQVEPGLGFEAGQPVTVAPTDYGTDPVAGRLVGLTPDRVTLERSDERAGTLHVHFPRIGFQILKDKKEHLA
jgi:glutathione S-transferase